MSVEENKRIARRYFEELWNQGNLNVISEIIAVNHTYHDPANPNASGPEGMKQLVTGYRTAFPDAQFTIGDQIAEGDKVVTRWSARGTQQRELMGVAPSHKQMMITGMDIHHIVNGKIVEHWSNWDTFGLMQQLGVVSPKAGGGQGDAALTVEQFEEQDADVTAAPPQRLEEAVDQEAQPGSKGGSSAHGTSDSILTVEQFEEQDADVTTAIPEQLEESVDQEVQPGSKGGSST